MWLAILISLLLPPASFEDASALSISAAGQVFVLDAGASRLMRLRGDGGATDSTGGAGSRLNAFRNPTDVDATHELAVFVADPENRRIVRLDRQLQYVSEIGTGSDRIHRLAVNANGELFGLDTGTGRVLKFRRNGERDGTFTFTSTASSRGSDIATVGDDVILAEGTRIRILSRLGADLGFREMGSSVKRLSRTDSGLAVLASDALILTDIRYRETHRIPAVPDIRDVAVTGTSVVWLTRNGILRQVLD